MKVKIEALPIVMSPEKAMKIASGEKNPIVKAMARNKKINMRVMYLENRYYIYEMVYEKTFLEKMSGKNTLGDTVKKIRIIVEATTCSASYTSDPIETEEIEVDEESIQPTYYDDQRLEDTGIRMAKRMVRRRIGRQVSMRVLSMKKIYRPYYIAIYGDMIEGTKARYLPIAADGFEVNTTI